MKKIATRSGLIAQVTAAALCALMIVFYMNNIPSYYETLRMDCTLKPCSALAPAPPTSLEALSVYHLTPDTYSLWFVIIECTFSFLFYLAAFLIFLKSKRDLLGLLAMIALVAYGTTFTSLVYIGSEDSPFLEKVPEAVAGIGRMTFFLFLLLFPKGRFVPRWTVLVFIPFCIVQIISFLSAGTAFDLLNWSNTGRLLYYLTMMGVTIFSQVFRYRKVSSSIEKQQTKWVVYGAVISLLGSVIISGFFVYPVFADNPISYIYLSALLYMVVAIIPLTLVLAILRHRLWEIDPLVNRTILYGALTLTIILIYAGSVMYLGGLFKTKDNFVISMISTGVVAVLFSPLKERLQRIVNRLMKGRHDDPYTVLKELGDHLVQPLSQEEVLKEVAGTIKGALRLPFVGIFVRVKDEEKMAVAAGNTEAIFDVHSFPIIHGGEELGTLMVSSRSQDETFSQEDLRLMDVLLRQSGVILQNVKMTWGMQLLANDLQESREKLVLAREEERLQIRRNLHDDLAPRLLSLSFNVAAAEQYVKKQPDKAVELLGELRSVIRTTVNEIRTMVHDLRPPTLDEFGLIGSIETRINEIRKTMGTNKTQENEEAAVLKIALEAPEQLPVLPAAVEVAAYRIITEALVNVVKHAQATECVVRISVHSESELQIEVSDNGLGLPILLKPSISGGIGLKSIRERTAELGGQCFFEKLERGSGTRVRAIVPFLQREEKVNEGSLNR
ncbi:GAF domain-containing sensor histidine kinase [Bacillus sp. USDA818B3_A]|uniref:GAF domain-containing sensor histidine kinase n=1 Tax=Bacillus sp. USDA818B3_A TaxID=2698834 RepID=UPI00136F969E|nr:GAF domain-containing sensor histidine kinase [Bacillus sp. USDA818B3_A]